MTVAELLGRIGSAELSEWMAFDALEREPDQPKTQTVGELKAGFAALAARSRKRKR